MPVGVVLAGGLGRRMAGLGPKPAVRLAGRPLIVRPVTALGRVCDRVAVVCKADTELPALPEGIERWDEPAEPRHPLAGILHALERARGPVLMCAADMPFVGPEALRQVLGAAGDSPSALAVVAEAGGGLEPALGLYRPRAARQMREAGPGLPLRRIIAALDPVRVALAPGVVCSVNTPEDLAAAEAELLRLRRSAAQQQGHQPEGEGDLPQP